MVVFTCSNCGDSVKKPQVEKHFAQRRCWGSVLCCIDCLKDFPGDEYKSHNSCITENERYGGKNYVAKPNVNKGEQKQQIWFEKVLSAIEKARGKNPPWLQNYFDRLKDYPNIPSKKAKFESFLRNSLGVRDNKAITLIWTAIDQNIEKQVPPTNQTNGKKDNSNEQKSTENPNVHHKDTVEETNNVISEQNETEKKLSKRERKENRKKEAHKKEKKDANIESVNGDNTEVVEKKKKKKRKDSDSSEKHAGKKRKLDELDDSVTDENGVPVTVENGEEEVGDQSDEEEPAKKRYKTKFDWSGVIVKVLQGKDSEIKMKKLRKKVLGEYLSQGCTEKSEEKLWAKFDKKLKKNPLIKIQNDRVKLKN